MSLYAGLQDLSGATYTNCNHVADPIDLDMLRVAASNDEALPTAGDTERDKYHGAVVFDPRPGVHRNVCYPDYSSLYPSIMIDCNMSPETILGVGDTTLVRSPWSKDELRWSYIDPRPVKHLDEDELYSNYTDGEYKMVYDPNSNNIKWRDEWSRIQNHLKPIYFVPKSEREGTLASRAETYIKWNKSYSGTMYAATKRQRNGLYGVSGDSNFRLFDWRVAEAVTIAGRLLLEFGADKLTERLQSTFSDESVYVTMGDSIPADEPTIVRRYDGTVDVLSAHRVHECVTAGEQMEIWSDDGWTEIKRSIEKPNRKQNYIARTKSGVVRVTEDHSLLRGDGTEVTPEEIDIGDDLLHRDIGDAIDSDSGSRGETVDVSRDEAWLLGLFVADGTAGHYEYDHRSDKFSWAITNENHDRLQRAQNVMSNYWGFETSINDARESSGCWKLQSSGQQYEGEKHGLRQDIVKEFCDRCYLDGEKRVPPIILNDDQRVHRAFLDGYLQGDGGNRGASALSGFDEMTTKSRVLATGLIMLIRQEGAQVTLDFDNAHGNRYYRIRRVSFHRGDPTEVKDIEPLEYDGKHVYDFETANHHFHAGIGSTIVHNTDGFGIAVDQDVSRGHVLPRVRETTEWLNDVGMPNFVEETFGVPADETAHEVDLESYSSKLFIPDDGSGEGTKKTYAQRVTWDEGDECDELSIKGFEAKRSDVADITVEVQKEALTAILENGRLGAQNVVYEAVRDAIEGVRGGTVPLEQLGQRSGLSKEPSEYGAPNRSAHPVQRGAKYAKKHIDGEDEFDKPMKFPVSRIEEPYPNAYDTDTAEDDSRVDYIAVEDVSNIPDEIHIDREEIIEKTIKQPLKSIFRTMDWEWSEAIHNHTQQTLSDVGV